ncbi:MAG: hypothetical protein WBQ94_16095, partial [Terracidiphilus sp.]
KTKPCPRKGYCGCQQGLDVRKISSPGGSGEVFFLDIPFYRTCLRILLMSPNALFKSFIALQLCIAK